MARLDTGDSSPQHGEHRATLSADWQTRSEPRSRADGRQLGIHRPLFRSGGQLDLAQQARCARGGRGGAGSGLGVPTRGPSPSGSVEESTGDVFRGDRARVGAVCGGGPQAVGPRSSNCSRSSSRLMDPPAPEPRVPPDDAFCEMLAAYDEQLAQGTGVPADTPVDPAYESPELAARLRRVGVVFCVDWRRFGLAGETLQYASARLTRVSVGTRQRTSCRRPSAGIRLSVN